MSTKTSNYAMLNAALAQRCFVKIIAGMSNFDAARVAMIAEAAQTGGATALDIAASPELVAQVKQKVTIPVFVSSSDPAKLIECVSAGADGVELDYDDQYSQGIVPPASEILAKAQTLNNSSISGQALISTTVSGMLPVEEQVELAQELVKAGIDFIQTEGTVGASVRSSGVKGLLQAATDALVHTKLISAVVDIPVITSGGMSSQTAPFAIAAGADGVCVGSSVNKQPTLAAMLKETQAIIAAVQTLTAPGRTLK